MTPLFAIIDVKLTVVIRLIRLNVAVTTADPAWVDLIVADALPLRSLVAMELPASRFKGVMTSPGLLDWKSISAPYTPWPSDLVTCAVIVAVVAPSAGIAVAGATLKVISFNINM